MVSVSTGSSVGSDTLSVSSVAESDSVDSALCSLDDSVGKVAEDSALSSVSDTIDSDSSVSPAEDNVAAVSVRVKDFAMCSTMDFAFESSSE